MDISEPRKTATPVLVDREVHMVPVLREVQSGRVGFDDGEIAWIGSIHVNTSGPYRGVIADVGAEVAEVFAPYRGSDPEMLDSLAAVMVRIYIESMYS